MAGLLVGVLRFLHIISAVAWVGGGFLWAMIIAPNVLARGPPPIRRPFLEAVLSKVIRFFIGAGVSAIVFGALLLGALWGWDYQTPFHGGYGLALGIGILAALLMILHGLFVITPSANSLLAKMQSLPANAPPSPEAQAELASMGKSVGMHGMLSVLLGTVALAGMVTAVNYVH